MFKIFTLIALGFLSAGYCDLYKQIKRNSKIVGNLRINDLDESFWEEN